MTAWLVIFSAAAVTFVLRISMVVVLHGRSMPEQVERVLTFAAPAAVAAIAANALAVRADAISPPPASTLVAVALAGIVVRRTGRPVHALVVGLLSIWLASLVGW